MARQVPLVTAIALLVAASATPSAHGQACRHQCRAGETRDGRGCCVGPGGRVQPAVETAHPRATRCHPGEHLSSGHCCGAGQEWLPARVQCLCVDQEVCGVVHGAPAARPAPASPVTPAGLIERYLFDGNASSSVGGPAGASSGVTPTESHTGRPGGALQFSGGGSVIIADNPRLPQGSSPRTLAMWVRADPGSDWRVIVTWGRTARLESFGLSLFGSTAVAHAYYADVSGTSSVTDGRWHHLAATYDGRLVRLFVNGVCEGQQEFQLATRGSAMVVGRALPDHPFVYALSGAVEDLQVYDRALTDAEVSALSR